MSSSAEESEQAPAPLDWYDFAGRDVPDTRGEFYSPERELAGVAGRAAQDLQRAEREAHAATDKVRGALFDLAVLVGRLEQLMDEGEEPLVAQGRETLHKQLLTVKNQMLQIMTDNGVELRDPSGRPAAEVLDWVEVSTWLHRPEFDTEVVALTEECAVFHENRVVRFAQVQMGAPTGPEAGQGEEQDRGEA